MFGHEQDTWVHTTATSRNIKTDLSSHTYRPGAQQTDQQVATEAGWQHLRDDIQVGHQGRLQDDGDVGGVEELDRVGVILASVTGRLDGQVHSEALRSQTEQSMLTASFQPLHGHSPAGDSHAPLWPTTALRRTWTEGSQKDGLKNAPKPSTVQQSCFCQKKKKKKSPPHYICINVEYTEDPEGHIHELSPNSGSLWWWPLLCF